MRQFQIATFSPETKGGWVLRFDDILADALELGPLRSPTITLPPGLEQRLAGSFPSAKPEVLLTLLRYYVANKQEDSPWVVLPVASFDAYFGTTAFSKNGWPNSCRVYGAAEPALWRVPLPGEGGMGGGVSLP